LLEQTTLATFFQPVTMNSDLCCSLWARLR